MRPLIQNARTTRHGIRSYFTESRGRNFRFFALPFEGISYRFFDVDQWRIAWGDLFFASPTGTWNAGTYSLVFEIAGTDGRAVLPIDLE